MVIEICRHGDRAPIYENLNYKEWDLESGQLTENGYRKHYLIGRQLRNKYNKFLSPQYIPSEIEIISTQTERTLQSAQSQMTGLFYQKGKKFSRNLFDFKTDQPPFKIPEMQNIIQELKGDILPNLLQTIPIYSETAKNDVLLQPDESCAKIQQLNQKLSPEAQKIYNDFEQNLRNEGFYDEYSRTFNITNSSLLNVESMQEILDTVTCSMYYHKNLNYNISQNLLNKMRFGYGFRQLFLYGKSNMQSLGLKNTNTFNKILTEFNSSIYQQNYKKKFILLSAHDNNLNNILLGLGVSDYTTNFEEFMNPKLAYTHENPPFASQIIFELYKDKNNKQHYVQILFNDKEVFIKGLSKRATIEQFNQVLQENIVQDWQKQCSVSEQK